MEALQPRDLTIGDHIEWLVGESPTSWNVIYVGHDDNVAVILSGRSSIVLHDGQSDDGTPFADIRRVGDAWEA